KLSGYGAHEPHLALYLAFLLLLRHGQDAMNTITARHLDFYYRQVLGMKKREAIPNRVHVLLELKKHAADTLIRKGTLLSAGKDKKGNELFYVLKEDVTVRPYKIAHIRSVHYDTLRDTLHVAPKADSSDGLGGAFDTPEPKWSAFGTVKQQRAQIGFALSSHYLAITGGERKVTALLTLSGLDDTAVTADFGKDIFQVSLTGKKGWIGPKTASLVPSEGKSGQFEISLSFSGTDEAVTGYDSKIHGGSYETTDPLMLVLLRTTGSPSGYAVLRDAVIVGIQLEVEVKGLKDLTVENDFGALDATKPFMPFGPSPQAGASLHVGNREAESKSIDSFSFTVQWKVPVASLKSHYQAYTDSNGNAIVGGNDYFTASLYGPDGKSWDPVHLFHSTDARRTVDIPSQGGEISQISAPADEWKVFELACLGSSWALEEVKMLELTAKTPAAPIHAGIQQAGTFLFVPQGKKKRFTLRLRRDFLHSDYRDLYARNVIEYVSGTSKNGLTLPEAPYTPVIETLSLNYRATSGVVNPSSRQKDDFLGQDVRLFHITAFGHSREHGFLAKSPGGAEPSIYLFPQYRNEGELYIGIQGLKPQQQASLLFQVAEGSANPEKDRVEVGWSVLTGNAWTALGEADIVSDSTKGLLRSGIIVFSIPREATDTDTVLPKGCVWLRAVVEKDTDALCQLIDVQANAGVAQFVDKGNDPSHLSQALPAKSITRLSEDMASVKTTSQPYASFGGRAAEDPSSFYTRVSERLRHKKRAITVWDYERLILEQFPRIYKVKCLSHTSPSSETAPGHVTVVVIPDLSNRNAVDPLRPRVDLGTLTEIGEFLKLHVSPSVTVHVNNPAYEEIKTAFKVAFKQGYDFGYWSSQLQEELKKLFCPWAYRTGADISFGGRIHRSQVISSIEHLPCIEYIREFRMYQRTGGVTRLIQDAARPSSARSILVSARKHTIVSMEGST
ncbi:MAG TPA: baseplate J/gp47 family protein, partial [Dissulfurispiraceae bacterium]|nr:baseplate J/gp47 family protein [Dissulfurispiraceae bacterium]